MMIDWDPNPHPKVSKKSEKIVSYRLFTPVSQIALFMISNSAKKKYDSKGGESSVKFFEVHSVTYKKNCIMCEQLTIKNKKEDVNYY